MTWHKQSIDSPLYPDIEWEKPERKDQAGKLLIIGGNLHGFAAPAKAYQVAESAGIGDIRIALPSSLRSTLQQFWSQAVFCPSTPSGGFARESLDVLLENAAWADGILIAGDVGRNSQTAIMLEELLASTKLSCAITKDALDYFLANPAAVMNRPKTVIVASFAELQKLASHLDKPIALTFDMPLKAVVDSLSELSNNYPSSLITRLHDTFFVAYGGEVSTTKHPMDDEIWRTATAARAIVSTIQHPDKLFEALITITLF